MQKSYKKIISNKRIKANTTYYKILHKAKITGSNNHWQLQLWRRKLSICQTSPKNYKSASSYQPVPQVEAPNIVSCTTHAVNRSYDHDQATTWLSRNDQSVEYVLSSCMPRHVRSTYETSWHRSGCPAGNELRPVRDSIAIFVRASEPTIDLTMRPVIRPYQ